MKYFALNLNELSLEPMASEHLCLNLTSQINWEIFSNYAEELLLFLGGEKISAIDGADMIIWKVCLNGQIFRLVFDDFPVMVSLESDSKESDLFLQSLEKKLRDRI